MEVFLENRCPKGEVTLYSSILSHILLCDSKNGGIAPAKRNLMILYALTELFVEASATGFFSWQIKYRHIWVEFVAQPPTQNLFLRFGKLFQSEGTRYGDTLVTKIKRRCRYIVVNGSYCSLSYFDFERYGTKFKVPQRNA